VIPLFLSRQVREADSFAINETGFPGMVLMENAAIEIFNNIKKQFPHFSQSVRVGIICGKGNNGGDGFAVARHFVNNGNYVKVFHLSDMQDMTEDANLNFTILTKYKEQSDNLTIKKIKTVKDIDQLIDCDIIIDAMLGSGSNGQLKDLYAKLVIKLNSLNAFKVAVDIPTGLDADSGWGDPVFKANLTIALAELKPGLFISAGYKNCGKIIKGGIGIIPSVSDNFDVSHYLIEPEDAYNYLPKRNTDANKYTSGKVLNISGSGRYTGAPMLASSAAFKCGTGAVVLAFPKNARAFLQNSITELVCEFYNGNGEDHFTLQALEELRNRIEWADSVLIGPGLGREDASMDAVRKFLKTRKNKKTVIDADALFGIQKKEFEKYNLENVILTPHMGEFANLIDVDMDTLKKNVVTYGKAFAEDTGAYLVLKGAPTIIFTPEGDALINTTGNPGMAKFGTGDVLSGIIAGITAQKDNIEEAVIASVYIHSLAADLLLNEYSEFGFTATDIINNLPKSIIFLRDSVV